MVQRQPGNQAQWGLQLGGREDLQHIRHDAAVTQHHTSRGAGGTGGVLQERHHVQRGGLGLRQKRLTSLGHEGVDVAFGKAVRQGVNRQDARALRCGDVGKLASDRSCGGGIGEDDRRFAVRQHSGQVIGMPRLGGVVERHRNQAGIQCTDEAEDVLRTVACQNGHAVTDGANLLQARRYRLNAGVDLSTSEVDGGSLTRLGEVPEAQARAVDGPRRRFRLVQGLAEAGQCQPGVKVDLSFVIKKLADGRLQIHGSP